MLNAKALSDLLSENSDERLCKCWFLLTLNGTMLAYTRPTNVEDLRHRAAMATLSWQEHQRENKDESREANGGTSAVAKNGPLHTLTVESESCNLIIRRVHPQLLLVLEGGVPTRKHAFETRITREGPGDTVYLSQNGSTEWSSGSPASSTSAATTKTKAESAVLELQRRKFDALAVAIAQDLERTGFKLPESSSGRLF